MTVTASDVLQLLRVKHAEDVFVDECKDGPTHGAEAMLRFDAWVMRKSWANPATIGYEIKVSRSDWLRDVKLTSYLSAVHEFYVVAPRGVLQLEELPDGVGYLEVASTGRRLLTKRKAAHREPISDHLLSTMTYVLMCRSVIRREHFHGQLQSPLDYWREFVAGRRDERSVGRAASKLIATRFREMEERAREVERAARRLKVVEDRLAERGVRMESFWSPEALAESILERMGLSAAGLRISLEQCGRALEGCAEDVRAALGRIEQYERAPAEASP